MTKIHSVVLISLLLIITYCSTGPDYERDNINDPKSNKYVPSISNLRNEIDSSGIIKLIWEDESIAESGFLIQKSISSNPIFENIDTLSPNQSQYEDLSQEFGAKTIYRVIPFFGDISDSSINDTTRAILQTEVKFGVVTDIIGLADESSDLLKLSWLTSSANYDAIVLEKNITNDLSSFETIDTLYGNTSSTFTLEFPKTFSITIRAKTFVQTPFGFFEEIGSESQKFQINQPSNFDLKFHNENNVSFSWSDNSDFEDYFLIYHTYEDKTEKFTITKDLTSYRTNVGATEEQHEFSLVAVSDNQTSSSELITNFFSVDPPHNFQIEPVSEKSVMLFWDYFESNGHGNFIVEKSINGTDNFAPIDTLARTEKSLLDENLNASDTYFYRIKTLSSEPTQIKGVQFAPGISLDRQITSPALEGEELVLTKNDDHLFITDTNNRISKFDLTTGTRKGKTYPNYIMDDINISPDNKYVATRVFRYEVVNGASVYGPYSLKIFDTDNFNEIQSLHVRDNWPISFEFSSDSKQIILLEYSNESKKDIAYTYNISTGVLLSEKTLESSGCIESLIRSNSDYRFIANCHNSIVSYNANTDGVEQIIQEDTPISSILLQSDTLFYSSDAIKLMNLTSMISSSLYSSKFIKLLTYVPTLDIIVFEIADDIFSLKVNSETRFASEFGTFEDPTIFYLKKSNQLLIRDSEAFKFYNFTGKWNSFTISN